MTYLTFGHLGCLSVKEINIATLSFVLLENGGRSQVHIMHLTFCAILYILQVS